MKLKDLLLAVSPHIYVHVYNSEGIPIASGMASEYQSYILKIKWKNTRKRLTKRYYAKVVDIFPDDYVYDGEYKTLGIQIDYQQQQ